MSFAIGVGIIIGAMWIAGAYIGGNNLVLWLAGIITLLFVFGGIKHE